MIVAMHTGRRTITLVTAASLALGVASCATGPDQPDTVAQEFAAALDTGDSASAAALTTDPAVAEKMISGLFEGLGNDDPTVTVAGTGEGDTFELDVSWNFGEGRDWSYRTIGSATPDGADESDDDDGWRIRWDPALLAPELSQDTSLRYTPTTGTPPTIFDSAGQPLMSEQIVTLVNLDSSADPAVVAPLLATAAPTITAASLAADLEKADGAPVTAVVLRDADLAPIEEQLSATPGVTLAPQPRLLTADRDLSSPVWSGLDEMWHENQAATAGWAVQSVAADGTVRSIAGVAPTEAPDMYTTIDPGLQARAESTLASFDRPAVIVGIDAETGAVRTVAQNAAADREGPVALTGLYPPGSTFKTVTTSAALQAGLAEPDTVLPCPGVATIGDRTIPNDESFDLGEVPLHTAFAHSCNTTMAALAVDMPPTALTDAALQFGLGVDYITPGLVTVTGNVPPMESGAARVEGAIGQGEVTASPFGMALVAASIAGGKTPLPMIVEGQQATADQDVAPAPEGTIAALRTMMRETVTEGTASALSDFPELIGKTGTAEYGGNNGAAGDVSGAHGWFIGAQDNLAFAVFVAGADSSAPAVGAAGQWLGR
ncbi:penicillin-binding protein [Rhodococcus sp. HNM0563]|uniref:penicillin-binding transpeptidase domain-containing protein n=2 Tax=unclassified Rhodococcus (in: high G+C Gram-positive bacteria) TaxID=192944 RepID=UPI00146D9417|nr:MULTISPECIES: penicillin-binding transpeptidase domain-containing protein [unclassified Rhodococcus (in: high G+C Gram-positive bacteria)]MCK0090675.1 penicillin-binding protein [Rhodococcus sp. F64268]NLU61869.1 penicillin-binding protein [Rhodococcus sp. HNM0563]